MLNVHGRTIWKNSKHFLSKMSMTAKPKKPNETKVEIFAHICTAKTKHSIPAVRHGGGEVMVWACFVATGPEHLAVKEKTWTHTKVFYSQI